MEKIMIKQKATIKKELSFSGVGIHSGQNVECTLRPSRSGEILFLVKDGDGSPMRVDPLQVESKSSSILADGQQQIHTVEHLLSALYVFGVDSVDIELIGNEIPIMDGSAFPIANALEECGIQTLPEKKIFLKITKPFVVQEKDASVSVEPAQEFKISYTIEFDHPLIQKQALDVVVNKQDFLKKIAPARTFGFLKVVERLWAQGLAMGGSLDNAIVLDEAGVVNGPLRFDDEFVRHKVLDFIGDLSLLGYPLYGYFKAFKAGHSMHLKVVRFLIDNPDHYTLF
jgi:UDP-3-O-[3-hydroxymyristoyl] N-acetylglucosamine deacetylase